MVDLGLNLLNRPENDFLACLYWWVTLRRVDCRRSGCGDPGSEHSIFRHSRGYCYRRLVDQPG
jgi:hypothetical protein